MIQISLFIYLFIYYIENKFDSRINFIYIHRNNEH